jgi:hypothetical protein
VPFRSGHIILGREGSSGHRRGLPGEAIGLAGSLASELGIDARFIEIDVYNLPSVVDERFNIVFTSYGARCWLPDLERWARVITAVLNEGGTFYMVEGHPLSEMFDDDSAVPLLMVSTSRTGHQCVTIAT